MALLLVGCGPSGSALDERIPATSFRNFTRWYHTAMPRLAAADRAEFDAALADCQLESGLTAAILRRAGIEAAQERYLGLIIGETPRHLIVERNVRLLTPRLQSADHFTRQFTRYPPAEPPPGWDPRQTPWDIEIASRQRRIRELQPDFDFASILFEPLPVDDPEAIAIQESAGENGTARESLSSELFVPRNEAPRAAIDAGNPQVRPEPETESGLP